MDPIEPRRDKPGGLPLQLRYYLSWTAIVVALAAMGYTFWELGGFGTTHSMDHVLILGMNVLPYLALIVISLVARRRLFSAGIALAGTVVTSGMGVITLFHAFHVEMDPQSGIVALVLPIFQYIFCGVTVGAIFLELFLKWVFMPVRDRG